MRVVSRGRSVFFLSKAQRIWAKEPIVSAYLSRSGGAGGRALSSGRCASSVLVARGAVGVRPRAPTDGIRTCDAETSLGYYWPRVHSNQPRATTRPQDTHRAHPDAVARERLHPHDHTHTHPAGDPRQTHVAEPVHATCDTPTAPAATITSPQQPILKLSPNSRSARARAADPLQHTSCAELDLRDSHSRPARASGKSDQASAPRATPMCLLLPWRHTT